MAAAPAPVRRTQEERSAETQRRVLDACLVSLVQLGWSGTTTAGVADHAGVSRGALLHHFPTRNALVTAAVQHLFAGLREHYEQAFAARAGERDRVRAALALLWEVFQDPRLLAVLELYVVARTDPALHAELLPVAEAHDRHVRELARRFFPESEADPEEFELTLRLVLHALHGMAVQRLLRPDDPALARVLARLGTLAASALAPDTGAHGRPR